MNIFSACFSAKFLLELHSFLSNRRESTASRLGAGAGGGSTGSVAGGGRGGGLSNPGETATAALFGLIETGVSWRVGG